MGAQFGFGVGAGGMKGAVGVLCVIAINHELFKHPVAGH